MNFHSIHNIVMIGAGKLAINFAISANDKGCRILQVYNRSPEAGHQLAGKVNAPYTDDFAQLNREADLYAIAVSDDALYPVVSQIKLKDQLVIHFSGTLEAEFLQHASSRYGVIYPPQTFLNEPVPGFTGFPICIEPSDDQTEQELTQFAALFTDKIIKVSGLQRRTIHLAAVFAGNFTNFMYSIAEQILDDQYLSIDILIPLIRKTAENAGKGEIYRHQTGPAMREDMEVIRAHLQLLADKPQYREIYEFLTENIIKIKNPDDKLL